MSLVRFSKGPANLFLEGEEYLAMSMRWIILSLVGNSFKRSKVETRIQARLDKRGFPTVHGKSLLEVHFSDFFSTYAIKTLEHLSLVIPKKRHLKLSIDYESSPFQHRTRKSVLINRRILNNPRVLYLYFHWLITPLRGPKLRHEDRGH